MTMNEFIIQQVNFLMSASSIEDALVQIKNKIDGLVYSETKTPISPMGKRIIWQGIQNKIESKYKLYKIASADNSKLLQVLNAIKAITGEK